METLTLQQLFGAQATQNINSLVIKKSDLIGLTPSATNTAESLLTSMCLKALESFQGYLIDESGQLCDETNTPLEYRMLEIFSLSMFTWEVKLIARGQTRYLKNTIVFEEYVIEPVAG